VTEGRAASGGIVAGNGVALVGPTPGESRMAPSKRRAMTFLGDTGFVGYEREEGGKAPLRHAEHAATNLALAGALRAGAVGGWPTLL
jgi:hypothetical protein